MYGTIKAEDYLDSGISKNRKTNMNLFSRYDNHGILLMVLLTVSICSTCSSFVVCGNKSSVWLDRRPLQAIQQDDSSNVKESEAERLLRRARELRAEAEREEEALHSSCLEKKRQKDAVTDSVIDFLFPENNYGLVFSRLQSNKRPSTEMLIRVVERLHEREVHAKGFRHVESSTHHDHTRFELIESDVDEEEVSRVSGLIDVLLSAAAAVDEQSKAKEEHHVSDSHFTEGKLASILTDRVRDLRREHDEQFQNRLEEYYDAAKKKKRNSDQKYFTKDDLDWGPPKP